MSKNSILLNMILHSDGIEIWKFCFSHKKQISYLPLIGDG
jgi:hypothetical protein